ncbi:unnamed protein product [Lota lota]
MFRPSASTTAADPGAGLRLRVRVRCEAERNVQPRTLLKSGFHQQVEPLCTDPDHATALCSDWDGARMCSEVGISM